MKKEKVAQMMMAEKKFGPPAKAAGSGVPPQYMAKGKNGNKPCK